MKLFHAPGTCSLGIRILLEEIGAPYEVAVLDLRTGAHRKADYLAFNPKGKVPALMRDDGSILTEFQAIALWLSRTHPQADLWPADTEGEARTLELLEFLVSTVHMRGFTLALVPGKFVPDAGAQAGLRAHGLAVADEGLARVAEQMGSAAYLNGARPGATDAALFYLLQWAALLQMQLPAPLEDFHRRMMTRAAVRRALDLPAA